METKDNYFSKKLAERERAERGRSFSVRFYLLQCVIQLFAIIQLYKMLGA